MADGITDRAVPIQRCWKEMLKRSDMQKKSEPKPSLDDNSENETVQVYLNQDMLSFGYLLGKTDNNVNISSVSHVYSEVNDSKIFTIQLDTNATIHLEASSVTLAQNWIQGLKKLIKNQSIVKQGVERRNEWLREKFKTLSTKDHHELKYKVVLDDVLNSRNKFVSPAFFKQKLKEYLKKKDWKYKENDGFPILEKFVEFYKYLFDRKDMVYLFRRISTDGAFVSPSDLKYFLSEEQYQHNVTQEHCMEVIVTNEVTQVGKENLQLSFDGFVHFMLSNQQQLFNPAHDSEYLDMNQPLPHYYIASSHNTYLSGAQLSGESSAEAYSNVLEQGCRCVELDCWDGDDEEPVVYHGYTLTTEVLFKDIIRAINKSAFVTSPYPVIVSLENHCSVDVQKKMASYLVEIFGDKMYTLPVDKSRAEFPSPKFFKNKILIRGKVGSNEAEVAKELSDLINYVSNAKFIDFDESCKNGKFWQSSSFVEGEMIDHSENNPEAFIRFNRRQLSRIYPGGMRMQSSNYNPITPWSIGCQIVALNHQTQDEGMALHHGKFRQNGRAGYILKPKFLRDPAIKFNPHNTKPGPDSRVLKMTIISGQQLPVQPDVWSVVKDEPDPYVYVEILGVPSDSFTFKTSTFYDNSFSPVWNESFETTVLVPELAMVKFSVYDKDIAFDDFIGQAVLPFESLQQGYRHLPLIDKEGVAVPCASIFVHVIRDELRHAK